MKQIKLLIVVVLLLSFSSGYSQNNSPVNINNYSVKAKQETERMKATLVLSPIQYQRVLEINTDYFRKLSDIRTSDITNLTLRRQKIEDLNKKRENELKQAINDWQFNKYKQQIDSIRLTMTSH